MPGKMRVTLIKSPISHNPANRATVRALGLHRIGQTVEVSDNPATRGMVRAVRFLVRTEETEGTASTTTTETAASPESADRPARGKRETEEKAS